MSAAIEPSSTHDTDIWYRLDGDDRIIGTGGAWYDVASEHRGEALTRDRVVGSRIYDHVAGHFTRKFLKDFLEQARVVGRARLSYRCDTPHLKRFVEMRAIPEDNGALLVIHRTTDEHPLPYPVHLQHVARTFANSLRCSVCNRLRRKGHKVWREPQDSVVEGEIALVIYTVCSDCRKSISGRHAEIDSHRNEPPRQTDR